MSRLAEFRALEQQLAAQLAELESLKNDDGLKREIEFEKKLRNLLGEYNYSLRNVVAILDPQAASRRAAPIAVAEKGNRKPRQVKQYKNPHTGEVIETKGGNHKQLKEWKAEHGAEEVESWLAK
ncbi:DNA binding protein [Pseudomonas qingdaonensis]|uniref:DNA binding protein n=1 Tax=Pseudomonas qingdaonensis TaxID=2056231 RepID=A0ABX8DLG1_9PSED|nr:MULTISPECIES: histone-like nucleoid-structuring protein, MvaT/MvaU family [Pseudomonas]MDD1955688.1 DNA binding protein [Pseudomonas sp. 8209]MEC6743570.1 histone-like nucleoid-structuring protein, MvaT/MvaU family [Pseudomonas qingdaonensis]PPS62407.1 transcriptional regulator [Pseudomonas sp. BRM28]QVL16932.1 DNA binding protein [Pseudomonas qingdaonensis]